MLYEYKCYNCDSQYEFEHRITEEPEYYCTHCENQKLVRQISNSSFILKGGCWYKDGYSTFKNKT